MVNSVVIDTFDSQLLGTCVAKIMPSVSAEHSFFSQAESFFVDEQVGLVFCSVPYDVNLGLLLNEYGYYLVSSRILYRLSKHVDFNDQKETSVRVIEDYQYAENDSFLADITADLAAISHYGKDPFIGIKGALSIYKEWMKNTFSGYAQKVFVATNEQGQCGGILSIRSVNNELVIDLLGVHDSFRKKGVATILLRYAVVYAQQLQKSLLVATQVENIPANRFYQKHNFLVESVELVYHKLLSRK